MRNRLSLVFLATIVWVVISQAQWQLESPLHALVLRGIDFTLNHEYERADSVFRSMIQRYPDHPAGYLYRAAVMQAYSMDFEAPVDREKFDSLLTAGKRVIEKISPPWRGYFLGTADGYDAYERVEQGDWFGGVKKGMSSASTYEKIIEEDSSFYDAYVGLGTYYYWRSRKTEFLHWLPFIKDDRARGIHMLVVGAERSEYNRFAAVSALISIYLDAENYTEAERWAQHGLRSYPENRIFLWGLATALDRQNRPADAAAAYSRLLQNIEGAHAPNPYNEIVCRLNLVKAKIALNDTVDVAAQLRQLLSYEPYPFPPALQSRAEAKFEAARALLAKTNVEH